jgi:hypothetical protein
MPEPDPDPDPGFTGMTEWLLHTHLCAAVPSLCDGPSRPLGAKPNAGELMNDTMTNPPYLLLHFLNFSLRSNIKEIDTMLTLAYGFGFRSWQCTSYFSDFKGLLRAFNDMLLGSGNQIFALVFSIIVVPSPFDGRDFHR